MQIGENSVVTIHFTLKNEAGELLDSSEGKAPLEFMMGAGEIIPGLETALIGHSTGDKFSVVVEPADAYGEYDETALQQVPMTAFEEVEDLEVGTQLYAGSPEGPIPVRVAAIEDGMVTIDANHELAGQRLDFSIQVESVRMATKEELG